jgi:hypothetical protein
MKLLLFFITIVLFSQTAYAYIDPGTGSYIFQLAIAGILGGLFFIKTSWRRIVAFFGNLRRKVHDNKR